MQKIPSIACVISLAAGSLCLGMGSNAFHDKPASARSLPGDNLPPFGMLDDQGKLVPTPPTPADALHRGPGSSPESNAPGPALRIASEAARAAIAACEAAGYRVGATVIDSIGEARAMLTADGSDGSHVFVAMRKAETALVFKMPSSEVHQRIPADKAMLARVTAYMFVEGGAVPILLNGRLIGAIGVSGAGGVVIGQQDEACARAGLQQIRAALK